MSDEKRKLKRDADKEARRRGLTGGDAQLFADGAEYRRRRGPRDAKEERRHSNDSPFLAGWDWYGEWARERAGERGGLSSNEKGALIIATAILAAAAAVAVIFFSSFNLTPEEVAERHVNDKIDAIGETIAGVLLLEAPILSELGGEWVEDRIHDVVKWRYAPARKLLDDRGYIVVATASASFDFAPFSSLSFSLPFDILISPSGEVTSMNPNAAAMSLALDLDAPGGSAGERASDALRGLPFGN